MRHVNNLNCDKRVVAAATADKCVRAEDQTEMLDEARRLGRLLGDRLA